MRTSIAYRNVRYARAARFEPAQLVPLDAISSERPRGPVPPQSPSRFDALLGAPAPLPQSENCQVLSVFTPGLQGKRPVMIWFHGGAFITGGGELPWYDGSLLAEEQDVVVVSVTARLGALGYLQLDGAEGPSPATTDQMAAVEWVRRHIDRFGGDPDELTLFGQSAGGFAIEVMLRWGFGPHVKGAIVQSGFIKQESLTHDRESAGRQATAFEAELGGDPRSASVDALLAAQGRLANQAGTVEIWGPVRPETERAIQIPLIAGSTRHDTLPYVLMERGISASRPEHLEGFAAEIERRNHVEITIRDEETLAEAVHNGSRAWLYRFDGDVPESGWGSPHCIELPFLLGGHGSWREAPILRGADGGMFDRRGRQVRALWASFARNRCPSEDWVPFDPSAPVTNHVTVE